MKHMKRAILAAGMAVILLFLLCVPAHGVRASDCNLRVVKNNSYNQNGKFYMSFDITSGRPVGASEGYSTYINAQVINSSGKAVFTWNQREQTVNTIKTQLFSANYNPLPSGTYTFVLRLTSRGRNSAGSLVSYSFTWKYTLTHTQTGTVNLSKVEIIAREDGTYANKFFFNHSGAKGLQLNMQIYNQQGTMVYSAKGNAISYTSGGYNFTWSGFPSGGGVKCSSGNYTIKYWLGGRNAKQTTCYLSIY